MGRKPTHEERRLWQRFTRDVQRLQQDAEQEGEHSEPITPPPPTRMEEKAPPSGSLEQSNATCTTPAQRVTPAPVATEQPLLKPDDAAGIDARTLRRFRQGKLSLQGTLDLHGFNREQASFRFRDYLAESQQAGRRVVCVITGHGIGRDHPGAGVLREALLQWVNWPENRARILTFQTAPPEYGGQGAYLLLLRRLR